MPDESVPHLRNIEKHLSDLKKTNRELAERMEGTLEQLEASFQHLHESVEDQTRAQGEMRVLTLLGELEAVSELIDEEEERLEEERGEDRAALEEFEQGFERTLARIAEQRNERVEELLGPLLTLMERDHDQLLVGRQADLDAVLRDFYEVTVEEVERREASLRGLLQEVNEETLELLRQREEVLARIGSKKLDTDLDGEAGEEVVYGVPFYLVEIESDDGETRTEVVPPSRMASDSDHLFGLSLDAVPGFDEIVDRLAENAERAWGAINAEAERAGGDRRTLNADHLPRDDGSMLDRWVRGTVLKSLAGRVYRWISAGEPTLADMYEREREDAAAE